MTHPMTQTPLDELAQMSEEQAVRRRFDEANVRRIYAVLIIFVPVTFVQLIWSLASRRGSLWITALCAAGLLLDLGIVVVLRRRPRINVRAWTVGYFALQYLLLVAASVHYEMAVTWPVLFPLMMLGLRFSAPELLAFHAFLWATTFVATLLGAPPKQIPPAAIYGSAGAFNGAVLLLNLLFASGARKEFLRGWLEERRNAREQVRMRDELQAARQIQLSMLPESAPDVGWLEIAATSQPATEVGGDYYDYFEVGDGRVAIVIGDVAGHGLASAIVLAAVRSGFTLLRDQLGDPAAVLRRIDELIVATSRRRMLVTMAILLLDRERGRATITSAGHPPVIVKHAGGSTEAIELYAPPLGVKLKREMPQRTIDFGAGDLFVLHTDGAYEARDPEGEPYGFDRLLQLVEKHSRTSAAFLRDSIVRDIAHHRGHGVLDDDLTAVIVNVTS
jgi:hypothetical protein